MEDSVQNILDALKADPLINEHFKRGLESADKTHREFRFTRRKISFDSKCLELAQQFLSDCPPCSKPGDEVRRGDELAGVIQQTIEDWIEANPAR